MSFCGQPLPTSQSLITTDLISVPINLLFKSGLLFVYDAVRFLHVEYINSMFLFAAEELFHCRDMPQYVYPFTI